jgi:hypothetical protein
LDSRNQESAQIQKKILRKNHTRGAVLKQIHGMGTRSYVLSVDNDNEFHDASEYELVASGLPRAYVSPKQPWKN